MTAASPLTVIILDSVIETGTKMRHLIKCSVLSICSLSIVWLPSIVRADAKPGAARRIPENCAPSPEMFGTPKQVFEYAQKTGDNKYTFTIAGVGNHAYLLDPKYIPISPEVLASKIKANPKHKTVKRIILAWSYSALPGSTAFLTDLQKLFKIPVKGFEGPLWWYPDGSAFSTRPNDIVNSRPAESNVAQCITPDGEFHEKSECKSLFKTVTDRQPAFSNNTFIIPCEELEQVRKAAADGDPKANMSLFFYEFFVNVDADLSLNHLASAASRGHPLARSFVAPLLEKTPTERAVDADANGKGKL